MSDINVKELSLCEMEAVSGGTVAINTGTSQNAGIWKKWESIASGKANDSLENGTKVEVIGKPRYNEAKGRNYVLITYLKKGVIKKGWIAASIVGLKR